MSAFTEVTLDTRAPDGTLDLITAVAGQVLRVAYAVDEPLVADATCVLSDGREIPMLVTGTTDGELACDLPPDATPTAAVHARTLDDVDNARTLILHVAISGTVPPPPDRAPSFTPPERRAPRVERRLIRSRSHARARVTTTTRRKLRPSRTTTRVLLRTSVERIARPPEDIPRPALPPPRTVRTYDSTRVRVLSRTFSGATSRSAMRAHVHWRLDRPPDPAVLELLDLL